LAATASGGATIAPRAIAAAIGKPAKRHPKNATAAVVNMTAITASDAIGMALRRKSVKCRVEKRRRHEQRQRKFRFDSNLRGERQESKTDACNREQGRVGHGEPFRQVREDDGCKQQHQNPLEHQHGACPFPAGSAPAAFIAARRGDHSMLRSAQNLWFPKFPSAGACRLYDNSTLSVSRPIEVVVLNRWVTETNDTPCH
jgi:hypothetical protein